MGINEEKKRDLKTKDGYQQTHKKKGDFKRKDGYHKRGDLIKFVFLA